MASQLTIAIEHCLSTIYIYIYIITIPSATTDRRHNGAPRTRSTSCLRGVVDPTYTARNGATRVWTEPPPRSFASVIDDGGGSAGRDHEWNQLDRDVTAADAIDKNAVSTLRRSFVADGAFSGHVFSVAARANHVTCGRRSKLGETSRPRRGSRRRQR